MTNTQMQFDIQTNAISQFLENEALFNFPNNLYDSANYILSLQGKRLRPLMTLLVAEGYGISVEKSLSAACSLEMFHNFTLVHDDIMDKAPLRRGKATVHELFGIDKAILTGDAMLPQAISLLIKGNEDKINPLAKSFLKMSREVMEGQQFDIEFEQKENVSIDEYLNMIRLKTSVLFGCACEIGAILGNTTKEDQKKLYDFGLYIGLAFQIMDDYLDSFGGETFGKKIGGDILLNKKTFLMINAIKEATSEELEIIRKLLNEKDEEMKIHEFQSIFKTIGVHQMALNQMNEFHQKAIESLTSSKLSSEGKDKLMNLSTKMLGRKI